MESIKSFLGNPYYLMTAVLAIAAFGFAATAVISLIQERKQKKEETQEEPLEKKLGVDTKKLKNVLNVPDLKRKKNIPVIEEEKTENAPEELPNDKEEVPVSNIDTEPEVLNPADVAEFKSRMIEHFRRKDTLQQSLLELQELYENGPILERIEKALMYSQRSRYRDFETSQVMDLTMNYELKMYVRFAIRTYHILTTNMKSSANRSHVLRSIH